MKEVNRNRCSYWYPFIKDAIGLDHQPISTFIRFKWSDPTLGIQTPLELLDPEHYQVLKKVGLAIEEGAKKFLPYWALDRSVYPFWLRGDLVSGKHTFPDATGKVTDFDSLLSAFCAITEHAEMALWTSGDDGTDTWVAREYIIPAAKFTAYRGHPVGPEWRLIVRNGEVTEESGLYWPYEAIKDTARWNAGPPVDEEELSTILKTMTADKYPESLDTLSVKVAESLGGDWSVDWMRSVGGAWYLIDMAVAEDSWIPNPVGSTP